MEIKITNYFRLNCKKVEKEILDILLECDDEFIPSLSSKRIEHGKEESLEELLLKYLFEKRSSHCYAVASVNNKIIGFMNYILDFVCYDIKNIPVSTHIDTLCIKKDYRNNGISQLLYEFVEKETLKNSIEKNISVGTWSTNKKQEHILNKRNYSLVHVGNNNRDNGIDSLIYLKKLK